MKAAEEQRQREEEEEKRHAAERKRDERRQEREVRLTRGEAHERGKEEKQRQLKKATGAPLYRPSTLPQKPAAAARPGAMETLHSAPTGQHEADGLEDDPGGESRASPPRSTLKRFLLALLDHVTQERLLQRDLQEHNDRRVLRRCLQAWRQLPCLQRRERLREERREKLGQRVGCHLPDCCSHPP
ncbi:hypothetical protein KUCAC02_017168 [Chaenocephalus aceratus]|uniref:Uncharacterized protein n=1 Tax=Chaenocephalus aceratus TaxID=36190 RepID=A0ACB9W163_CHAAC|nr:hypothetical protein KUCAC02_017168 [Chaenocephalus aceratus]